MAGLVPAIHVFSTRPRKKDVDDRDKRGHDESEFWSSWSSLRGIDDLRRCLVLGHQRKAFPRGLGLALPVPHAGIKSAVRKQLLMGAALDDRAVVKHDDLVG